MICTPHARTHTRRFVASCQRPLDLPPSLLYPVIRSSRTLRPFTRVRRLQLRAPTECEPAVASPTTCGRRDPASQRTEKLRLRLSPSPSPPGTCTLHLHFFTVPVPVPVHPPSTHWPPSSYAPSSACVPATLHYISPSPTRQSIKPCPSAPGRHCAYCKCSCPALLQTSPFVDQSCMRAEKHSASGLQRVQTG